VISLTQQSKRIQSASYVGHYETVFACPICQSSMKVLEFKSLICTNHHTFDFAKQGYINLTTHSVKVNYSKELFEARRKLITEAAFYEPLIEAIVKVIHHYFAGTKETLAILDTGCGEGSHLSLIYQKIRSNFFNKVVGVGIDLSKEGIMVAAKNYSEQIWAVADLANTPFKDSQFDVILNILSPSNYAEFNRLLKSDGVVIKISPQSGYLKELREHLFIEPEKQNYSNAEIVDRFNASFRFVESTRVTYSANLNQSAIQWLVAMTPLTWNANEEAVTTFLKRESAKITVDLDILIGKKHL
jgi:23S rRNA (guanine745-N1)-methyltransferase